MHVQRLAETLGTSLLRNCLCLIEGMRQNASNVSIANEEF